MHSHIYHKLKYKKLKIKNMRMRRNNDKMLLESLVRKYGKNGVVKTINEMAYKYDYNRLSDCPLTYNTQLDFKKYFIKRSAQEGYEFNKNVFYFDYIDCVDTKTSRDIPGVKANKTLNFDEAYNRLLKYFLNNLQEQVNESSNKETNMHNSPIYLCVDKDGTEKMYAEKYYMYNGPTRGIRSWRDKYAMMIFLPDGTINKLIGHDLTWDDEPFKYN
jgi:hypothetical protein